MSDEAGSTEWWGRWKVREDEIGHWQIGPLSIWIARRQGEWRVAAEEGEDHLAEHCDVTLPAPPNSVSDKTVVHRFAVADNSGIVEIRPRLADRSIVIRPQMPFHLLPGEDVHLFMSTAVWIQLLVGEPGRSLMEIPSFRPSDTWFGESSRFGELCYAGRTSAHLMLENLTRHRARAITPVRVRNQGTDELLLERINLPVPTLSLYVDDESSLWTDSVTVNREKNSHLAEVRLDRVPSSVTSGLVLISEARVPQTTNVFVRAIGSFLR